MTKKEEKIIELKKGKKVGFLGTLFGENLYLDTSNVEILEAAEKFINNELMRSYLKKRTLSKRFYLN